MACRCPLVDYLDLYVEKQGELMSNSYFQGASDYGSSTYGTWEISMKEIEARAKKGADSEVETAKCAITLYNITAFLHHEDIPEELFKNAAGNYKKRNIKFEQAQGLPLSVTMLDHNLLLLNKRGAWDKMKFQLGMQMLMSFSLIKKNGELYSVHPLVHSWSKYRIPEVEIKKQILITRALLACSVELDYAVDNYKFCGLIAPHIRTNYFHAAQLDSGVAYYDNECVRFALVFHCVGRRQGKKSLDHTTQTL